MLIGGDDAHNNLYGDARTMANVATGGNDTLVSGTGTDHMWGDASIMSAAAIGGADTFVFAPVGGDDFIHDFRQSDGDMIDVSAYGFSSIGDMTLSDLGADTLIEFGASGADNSVTLLGFDDPNQLTNVDFIFA